MDKKQKKNHTTKISNQIYHRDNSRSTNQNIKYFPNYWFGICTKNHEEQRIPLSIQDTHNHFQTLGRKKKKSRTASERGKRRLLYRREEEWRSGWWTGRQHRRCPTRCRSWSPASSPGAGPGTSGTTSTPSPASQLPAAGDPVEDFSDRMSDEDRGRTRIVLVRIYRRADIGEIGT